MKNYSAVLLIVFYLLFSMLITSCASEPSEMSVQTAIAKTQESNFKLTPSPIPTLQNTETPTVISTPTQIPLSQEFRSTLLKFLEEGSKVQSLSQQGVNFITFGTAVADAKASYQMLNSLKPDWINDEGLIQMDNAFKGWTLTIVMWNKNIKRLENPYEPNNNQYEAFFTYAGDILNIGTFESNYIVAENRGKKYIPVSDQNISKLMNRGNDYFEKGKTIFVKILK